MPTSIITPGGLRLLVEELPHTYSVAVGCFIGAGARHEPDHHAGAAHFLEHMLFKGTERYPTAREISQCVEGVGGILNASTSYESTIYYAKVAQIHFDRALDVLADMVLRPRFDLRELEKERRVIIEEIRGLHDVPGDWVHELLQQALWGEHALGRDIAGSVETVSALGRADLSAFFQRSYNRTNMVVSVAGNVRTAEVVAAVDAAFADLSAGAPLHAPTSPVVRPGPCVTLRSRDTEQGNFCFGLPGLAYTDSDRRALQVLDSVLGGGMVSRLFQILREDHGMAYNVGSYHNDLADVGSWVIYGSVEPDALRDAVILVREILTDLATHGPSADELEMVKEQVKGGLLLSLEDTWSLAARNGAHQLRYGRVIPLEQVVAEVEAVTAADVLRVARRLIRPAVMHLAVIGPYDADDRRELEAILAGRE
jgi:predicted Zn-dependent peptidase